MINKYELVELNILKFLYESGAIWKKIGSSSDWSEKFESITWMELPTIIIDMFENGYFDLPREFNDFRIALQKYKYSSTYDYRIIKEKLEKKFNLGVNVKITAQGIAYFRELEGRMSIEEIQPPVSDIELQEGFESPKKEIKRIVGYKTDDFFLSGHIEEINRAYSFGCYTCVFVLCRKVIENLIIQILKEKFPENKKENKELYYYSDKRRYKDFSVILRNFYDKRGEFGTSGDIVERIYQLSKQFKDDADDKTHSLFHLVMTEKEIDDLNIENIFNLIKELSDRL